MRSAIILLAVFLSGPLNAETVFIEASQDNTLYESAEGELSNGATIQSVKLHLRVSRSESFPTTVNLLRVQANWGEGASHADGEEGQGGASQAGDATWLHRFFDHQSWNTPGGDFAEVASASRDVQDWKDNPTGNFGWILIAGEFMSLVSDIVKLVGVEDTGCLEI